MKIHDLLCENSGFSAPKARNVTAWAIGPGGVWLRFLALKARNESELGNPQCFQSRFAISRLQRFRDCHDLYPGRCPGLSHSAPLALRTRRQDRWSADHRLLSETPPG